MRITPWVVFTGALMAVPLGLTGATGEHRVADSESRWTRTATAIPRGYNEHHSAPSLVSNRSFAPANLAGFFHPRTVNFRCSYRGSDNLYTGPPSEQTSVAPQWTAVRVLAEIVVGGITGYATAHLWSVMNTRARLGGLGVGGLVLCLPAGFRGRRLGGRQCRRGKTSPSRRCGGSTGWSHSGLSRQQSSGR